MEYKTITFYEAQPGSNMIKVDIEVKTFMSNARQNLTEAKQLLETSIKDTGELLQTSREQYEILLEQEDSTHRYRLSGSNDRPEHEGVGIQNLIESGDMDELAKQIQSGGLSSEKEAMNPKEFLEQIDQIKASLEGIRWLYGQLFPDESIPQ